MKHNGKYEDNLQARYCTAILTSCTHQGCISQKSFWKKWISFYTYSSLLRKDSCMGTEVLVPITITKNQKNVIINVCINV